MRNWNKHLTSNQNSIDLKRSNYTSITSRRMKYSANNQMYDTKTKFNTRLQKACTTMSNADINKQFFLYRKQIQRLQKQILKKDKIIFENKSTFNFNKELEAQLVQTYRIIYLYQGKMSQYEKQLKRLELTISQKMQGDMNLKVQQLLQSYRKQNAQLKGQISQKDRLLFELEQKMKKLQNKYFNTSWKLSSTNRQIHNPLKKKFPNLRNTITIKQVPLIQKQKEIKNNMRLKQQLFEVNKKFDQQYYGNNTSQSNNFYTTPNRILSNKSIVFQGNNNRQSISFKKVQAKPINIEYGYTNNHTNQNKLIDLGNQQRISKTSKTIISPSSSVRTLPNYEQQSRQSSGQKRVYASPIARYEINKQYNQLQKMINKYPQTNYPQSRVSNRIIYHN